MLAIRNQRASIKTLEIQIGQMSKVLQERGFRSLPSSTEMNPRDQVKSILNTIEADSHPIRRIGSPQYAVSTGQNRTLIWKNDGYCNGGNLPGIYIIGNQLHYQDYEWYEALEDSELKDEL
ncbi:hypothetical protein Tco_0583619 [Tanacetum coccineum]